MKQKIKISLPLLITLCVLVTLLSFSSPIMLLLVVDSRSQLENEDFYAYESDFKNIADFLVSFAEEHPEENYIIIGFNGSTIEKLSIHWSIVGDDDIDNVHHKFEFSKDIAESLLNISEVFSSKGCMLDAIRIRENGISFDDFGPYSLVYAIDGVPPKKIDTLRNERVKLKRIEKHWYHRLPKRTWWR